MAKKDKKKKAKDAKDSVKPLPPASETMERLERLSRLIRSASQAEGLSPVQWEALRYLRRCNRFSNTPSALARFLASTKGTVSQTVQQLEKRGLVRKDQRGSDSRSISLVVTETAHDLLGRDPLLAFVTDLEQLEDKTRRRLSRGSRELLAAAVTRRQDPVFQSCLGCANFQANGNGGSCEIFKAELAKDELRQICVSFRSAG
jgi:DNA-binding MarR family transcriptional regulator